MNSISNATVFSTPYPSKGTGVTNLGIRNFSRSGGSLSSQSPSLQFGARQVVKLFGFPSLDNAIVALGIAWVGALGSLPFLHNTQSGKAVTALETSARMVARESDGNGVQIPVVDRLTQLISEFDRPSIATVEVDITPITSQIPALTESELKITKAILESVPEGATIQDIQTALKKLEKQVFANHLTAEQLFTFDESATHHLENLQAFKNVQSRIFVAGIVCAALQVALAGVGFLALVRALRTLSFKG